ncbi:hypothetical protein BD626DRAFT_538853 [Schizophyllum amplum]|uniref:BZIP domain-containing protein n=1 Tax=Schizophyllum amplum TaxID=97359 RepID=A0A550C6M6_9AGAR|nr:hypothetical protein BD626DRAFT_538853 [Auriculariopsis ampla]
MSVESPSQAPPFAQPGQHDIISEIFNLDLFANNNDSNPSSASNASSPQSHYSHLATPSPLNDTLHTFPQTQGSDWDFAAMFAGDHQMKDDIFGSGSAVLSAFEPSPMVDANYAASNMGIDPQLMESPTAIVEDEEQEAQPEPQPEPQPQPVKPEEKIMLTIQPVKTAGHGSKRQGTVASGGITKTRAAKKVAPPSPIVYQAASPALSASDDMGEEDWRPSPEVLSKMSSKEKRQLRNKISARNFRVRRKEYITHLEFDIAERDRLLDAIRTDLTSTQHENQALRKEVETLKQALLAGRTGSVELPPPKELVSVQEMLEATSNAAAGPSTPPATASGDDKLLKPNTQKDLSPNAGSAFWGGWGMGSGITPVHTVLVPSPFELGSMESQDSEKEARRKALQENINPAMNENLNPNLNAQVGGIVPNKAGFDSFADREMFTMKSLDAYRMHLWSKMAASHPPQHQPPTPYSPSSSHTTPSPPGSPSPFYTGPAQPHGPYLSGLAGALRPAYFKAPTTSPSLSSLLSGKHTGTGLSSMSSLAAALPSVKEGKETSQRSKAPNGHEEKQQQHKEAAAAAMVASQTLIGKLGSAFWDAFSGAPASGVSSSSSHGSLDSDKVRRVLEGKAVLKVVDVEAAPAQAPKSPTPSMASLKSNDSLQKPIRPTLREKCSTDKCASMLEESMRSLSLGRRA